MASPDALELHTGVEIGITSRCPGGLHRRDDPHGPKRAPPSYRHAGHGASIPLLSLIGLAGILVLSPRIVRVVAFGRRSDLRHHLLVFVSVANFGTAITGIYSSAIGLRNFAALERVSWSTLLLITIAPVALVAP